MNETIIDRHNSLVLPEDDVYVLGDLMLGDNEKGIELVKQMNGKLHIAIGNHDTTPRIELYKTLPNLVDIQYVYTFKYKKYNFYCSHYPTLTGNLDTNKPLSARTINLCGHKHTKNAFEDFDKDIIYHVELDAHAYYPINIDYIIEKTLNILDKNDQSI